MRKFLEQLVIFIRPLWFSRFGLFGLPCNAYYTVKWAISAMFDSKFYVNYICRKNRFSAIQSLDSLTWYFRNIYEYKYDPLRGLIDHHAGSKQFFGAHGDCDDVALYAIKALRRLNKLYGDRYECYFATVFPPDIRESHNDCFVYDKIMNVWFAFNYGNLIYATSREALFQAFSVYWFRKAPEKANIYLKKM